MVGSKWCERRQGHGHRLPNDWCWISDLEFPDKKAAWWFQITITPEECPWAFVDKDSSRRIAALEMLGTLLLATCLIQQGHSSLLRLQLALMSDNQGNVYALLNQQTRKMPTAAFLMQLVSLLYDRGAQLAPHHCKRDHNQWADDLTHPDPVGFTPERRLSLTPVFEEFALLPQILPLYQPKAVRSGGDPFSFYPPKMIRGVWWVRLYFSVWGGWYFDATSHHTECGVHVMDQVWTSHIDKQQPHRQHLSWKKGNVVACLGCCWHWVTILARACSVPFSIVTGTQKHILQEPKRRTVNACVSRGPGSQFRIIIYTIGRNGQVQVSSHFVPISGHGRPCRSPLTATERPKCPGWHGPRPCCRWAFHAMPPSQPLMRSPRSQTHHSGFVSTVPLSCTDLIYR